MNEQNKIIGKNIRSSREQLGLSQEALAEFLEVSHVTISYYENGHRSIPIRSLLKMSYLFGIEPNDLSKTHIELNKLNKDFSFKSDKL